MSHKETFINPFTDFGFKKLFGEEDAKEYLIDFLNSVFGEYIPYISELSYGKTEHLGNTSIDRNAIFDLYCKNEKGDRFIIELQKAPQRYFKERTLFYSTFAIQEQAEKGSEWNFKIDPIYCIGILNFKFHENEDKYLHYGKILDVETKETLIDTLNFAYLECSKFKKEITQNSSNQDKWIYVLSNLYKLDKLPNSLQNKIFERFFEKAQILKLNPEEKSNYNNSIKYYRDIHNVIELAENKGELRGLEKGLEQGIEKGLKQGELNKAITIARNLLKLNMPIDSIIQATGLTQEQIEKL
jgi:predicted transposase/invertase (TIGR01784 family)